MRLFNVTHIWSPDSKAIVDGNLKLILGLIWTLILHYSISMPMWDEEEEADDGKQKTPKQRLLGWIQNKLPELPITNFNRDWQTGRALGALVDSCAPGELNSGCVEVFWGLGCVGVFTLLLGADPETSPVPRTRCIYFRKTRLLSRCSAAPVKIQ